MHNLVYEERGKTKMKAFKTRTEVEQFKKDNPHIKVIRS